MTVSATDVKYAIGEVYKNLGIEGDSDATRDTIVAAFITRAQNDIVQIKGTATGYDQVVLPLAASYAIQAAMMGQGPNTLGGGTMGDMYDRVLQQAREASTRSGFTLKGSQFSVEQTNN